MILLEFWRRDEKIKKDDENEDNIEYGWGKGWK